MNKKKFDYYIKKNSNIYEVIIGLEVHAQVLSKSKLFSGSPTVFGAKPNIKSIKEYRNQLLVVDKQGRIEMFVDGKLDQDGKLKGSWKRIGQILTYLTRI